MPPLRPGLAVPACRGSTTGYLEEIAFEVVSTQSERDVTEKAEEMRARGVRRIFAILAASGVAVSAARREEILRCADLARLSRWVVRAAVAASADEVTAEP